MALSESGRGEIKKSAEQAIADLQRVIDYNRGQGRPDDYVSIAGRKTLIDEINNYLPSIYQRAEQYGYGDESLPYLTKIARYGVGSGGDRDIEQFRKDEGFLSDPGPILQQFKQVLGRDPRPDEIGFLKGAIDRGELDPYQVGQFLQGTPEAQKSLLQTQGQEYEKLLSSSDSQILQRQSDVLQSQFARQGRNVSQPMSGNPYINAMASAAKELAMSRQQQLADFYGGRLGNIEANALNQAGIAQQRGFGLQDRARDRKFELEDYYRQKNVYDQYLNEMNQRNRRDARNKAVGGLIGGGIGAIAGGWGAAPGAAVGGAIAGGQFGSNLGQYYRAF